MNFLAHIYLSEHDENLQLGNFIADSVRKSQWHQYPKSIVKGIEMHLFIDEFTDKHPIVKESKTRLYPGYGKYAPVIVDIFYDHFLAKNWNRYHALPLQKFTQNFYNLLTKNMEWMPERLQFMIPYMQTGDWLYNYQYLEGINRSLTGMSRRTSFVSKMEEAVHELEKDFDSYLNEFEAFFEELQMATKQWLIEHHTS